MAREGSRRDLQRRVPAPCRRHGHHRSRFSPVQSLAKSLRGANDRIPAPRMSRSRHQSEPDAFAPPARSLCLLLSWGANPSLPREGRAHATTRARVDGRSRGGIRGSWRPSPSVRATRSLTRCVTSRMAATVSDMGDLRPRTNRHAQRPSRRQSRSNVARSGSRSAVPSRRWILFGDGHGSPARQIRALVVHARYTPVTHT